MQHSPYIAVRGAEIRRHRQNLGLTIKDLAARVDISPAYLSQVERSTALNRRVGARVLRQIAVALGVAPESLRSDVTRAA